MTQEWHEWKYKSAMYKDNSNNTYYYVSFSSNMTKNGKPRFIKLERAKKYPKNGNGPDQQQFSAEFFNRLLDKEAFTKISFQTQSH